MAPARRCSGCGAPVSDRALESGRAIIEEDKVYCEDCAMLIRDPDTEVEEDALPDPDTATPTDATVELSIERLQRRLDKRRKNKLELRSTGSNQPVTSKKAFIIGALIVIIIIIVIMFLKK